ncbi:MAG: hydroxymethylbilane synthase, partial [Gemmatimonadota bacterium]|nr:hydroxymethylbilane synthase [Gemmatimonadota bacterium]
EDDEATRAAVAAVNHVDTWWEITAERACLHDLGAGCQAPVGVLARLRGGVMEVRGAVASPAEVFRAVESGRPEEAVALGRAVAEGLLTHPGVRSLVQG